MRISFDDRRVLEPDLTLALERAQACHGLASIVEMIERDHDQLLHTGPPSGCGCRLRTSVPGARTAFGPLAGSRVTSELRYRDRT